MMRRSQLTRNALCTAIMMIMATLKDIGLGDQQVCLPQRLAMRAPARPCLLMTPLFALLRGSWTLQRSISDQLTGSLLTASGTASFQPSSSGLSFSEQGQLQLPAAGAGPQDFKAAYEWRLPQQGRCAAVHFPDGRLFYELDLSSSSQQAVRHECSPDLYEGSVALLEEALQLSLRIEWRVSGPSKLYHSCSTYTRLRADGIELQTP